MVLQLGGVRVIVSIIVATVNHFSFVIPFQSLKPFYVTSALLGLAHQG